MKWNNLHNSNTILVSATLIFWLLLASSLPVLAQEHCRLLMKYPVMDRAGNLPSHSNFERLQSYLCSSSAVRPEDLLESAQKDGFILNQLLTIEIQGHRASDQFHLWKQAFCDLTFAEFSRLFSESLGHLINRPVLEQRLADCVNEPVAGKLLAVVTAADQQSLALTVKYHSQGGAGAVVQSVDILPQEVRETCLGLNRLGNGYEIPAEGWSIHCLRTDPAITVRFIVRTSQGTLYPTLDGAEDNPKEALLLLPQTKSVRIRAADRNRYLGIVKNRLVFGFQEKSSPLITLVGQHQDQPGILCSGDRVTLQFRQANPQLHLGADLTLTDQPGVFIIEKRGGSFGNRLRSGDAFVLRAVSGAGWVSVKGDLAEVSAEAEILYAEQPD